MTTDYQPTDIVRFVTPGGHDLTGVIQLMGDIWALVKVEKPAKMDILLDLNTVMGKVTT